MWKSRAIVFLFGSRQYSLKGNTLYSAEQEFKAFNELQRAKRGGKTERGHSVKLRDLAEQGSALEAVV